MNGIKRWRTQVNGSVVESFAGTMVLYHDHAAEIDRLRAEVNKLPLEAKVAELRAEVEAYRKDAERYRWLRDRAPDEWSVLLWIGSNSQLLIDDSLMDSKIDAAMGASA